MSLASHSENTTISLANTYFLSSAISGETWGLNRFTARNDKGASVQTQKRLFLKREGLFTRITFSSLSIGTTIFCLDFQ
jgi:hypothetical protein